MWQMLLRFRHEIPVCRASESFRSDRYVHASGEYNLYLPMQPGFPGSRKDLAPAPYRSQQVYSHHTPEENDSFLLLHGQHLKN